MSDAGLAQCAFVDAALLERRTCVLGRDFPPVVFEAVDLSSSTHAAARRPVLGEVPPDDVGGIGKVDSGLVGLEPIHPSSAGVEQLDDHGLHDWNRWRQFEREHILVLSPNPNKPKPKIPKTY